ncbi:MAG: glutamate synthase [Bacteroidetes bacterium]|nr:MAG: glutamate synthase [Bacteroidota bacterium]PTM12383.1 MAG: glutamate synthase [Bacteroidota bacterium]
MADPKGFLTYNRELPQVRPAQQRVKDYKELYEVFPVEGTIKQAARCMDCGVPFCHNGCPLGNIIPEFNDAVYEEDWRQAYKILNSTNNFPEFTGRICPAPCESACVLGINQPPVAIEHIEKSIAEIAFERGYVRPTPPSSRTGKKVAIVGSGPAGLAAADQLNRAGHTVTVLERDDAIGGLLRYGIPDFKLEKHVIDRRLAVMEAAGVRFKTNANVGENIPVGHLLTDYDAVVLSGGSTVPRDLPIPGRELKGVHFAMEFLKQNNMRVASQDLSSETPILATGKHVVVIGGGDTGADCVGTSNRHGAKSVTQIEIMGKPPVERAANNWPNWPMVLRTSTSHEEGCDREWALLTKKIIDNGQGQIKALQTVQVLWEKNPATGRLEMTEQKGTERDIPCELLLLAAGFLHPQKQGMIEQLGVGLDARGNVEAKDYQTTVPKIFVAGDMRRGQSLVVWAISEGREAARAVDAYLQEGATALEAKDQGRMEVRVNG